HPDGGAAVAQMDVQMLDSVLAQPTRQVACLEKIGVAPQVPLESRPSAVRCDPERRKRSARRAQQLEKRAGEQLDEASLEDVVGPRVLGANLRTDELPRVSFAHRERVHRVAQSAKLEH